MEGHDAAKHGFHKKPWGPDEKENHFIKDAHTPQHSGNEPQPTDIHNIALHKQVSEFASGVSVKKQK